MTPARALAERTRAMLGPDCQLAACSDADTYVNTVLVAIARPAASFVLAIPRAVYDGVKLMELLGLLDDKTTTKENHVRR